MAHGKESRKRNRFKRLGAKLALKAARQAQWDAVKGTAKNKKKKKNTSGGASAIATARVLMAVRKSIGSSETVLRKVHGGSECGNIGCKRCSAVWRVAA